MSKLFCILFYGQFRYDKEIIDKLYKNVISINNCEVYCHFWDYENDVFTINQADLEYFLKLINPVSYVIELQKIINWKEYYTGLNDDVIDKIENGICEKYNIPNSQILRSVKANISQITSKYTIN